MIFGGNSTLTFRKRTGSLMIKKILFLFLIFLSHKTTAQDSLTTEIREWFNQDFESDIDLSSGFYQSDCSYLGIFGNNNHKFNIRFDSVSLKNYTQIYYVEGRSILNNKITPFKGELKVTHIDLLFFDPLSLVASGSYLLTEEDGGVFKGVFRRHLTLNDKVADRKTFDNIQAEVSWKEGFAGSWIDPKNGTEYRCHFGFYRYPEILTGDFDTKGGEPHIHPKYQSFGWDNYFEKQNGHGVYSNTECDYDWWK